MSVPWNISSVHEILRILLVPFLKGLLIFSLGFFFSLLVLFTSLNAVVLGVKGENKSAAHLNYWKLLIIIILVLSKAFCAETSSQLHLEHLGLLSRCFQLMWFFFFFLWKENNPIETLFSFSLLKARGYLLNLTSLTSNETNLFWPLRKSHVLDHRSLLNIGMGN